MKRFRKREEIDKENSENYYSRKMDELLDKINKYGHNSLTSKEKRLLKEASKFLEKRDED